MKKASVIFLAIALAFFLASPASALMFTGTPSPSLNPTFGTLVTFDDYATGTAVGATDYLSAGVASITETEGFLLGYYSGTQSSPNYIGTGVNSERGTDASLGWDGTILFEFTGLADMVGIGIADSAGGPEYVTAYDSSMNIIESYTAPSGTNTYVGIDTGFFNIKYFSITGDFFAVDDLQFNATSVPEPSSLFFLITGAVGLIGASRKRLLKK